jgi:hypothetical protein
MREDHRRRISYDTGRALEILGHAIDYLTDEFVHEGGCLSSHKGELEAIQLLMARNREIYLACPVVPTFQERWAAFIRVQLFRYGRTHDCVPQTPPLHPSR